MPSEPERLSGQLRCLKLPNLQVSVRCKGVLPDLLALMGDNDRVGLKALVGLNVCVNALPCSQNWTDSAKHCMHISTRSEEMHLASAHLFVLNQLATTAFSTCHTPMVLVAPDT